MTQTIAERLAQFSESLQFDDIPPEVIDKTKRLALDTIGVCIGSTQIDFGKSALKLVARWGGAREATMIGRRAKVPAHNAALCNGILGHGQDYDDTHTESVVHTGAALAPVALAVAERTGCSGREMLTALVGGLEATIRIAMPALNKFHLRGFHTTSVAATFGAALIAAKLEKIGLQRTVEAVGISGSFTSGLLECIPAGSGAKRLHAGWGALCGIVAAQLAQGDYTGPNSVFEGKLGVYNSFLRGEPLDLDVIFKGLGHDWETLNIRPKLYPCCHYLQAFLDCAAALRREQKIRTDDIAGISCRIAQGAVNIVCEPWEKKLNPITGYDARFSLPFAVALMLTRGKAGVAEFSEQNAADPQIRQLMAKVSYAAEPKYEVKDMPGWIEVTLKDGKRHVHEIPEVRGNAKNPVALEELLDKFDANTSFLGAAASSRIADDILALDKQADIHGFMARLGAPKVAESAA
ncbi:MAG: MmgE/PrpD family protein [Betaproteobacteria bacterium]|nr:MmgE/PrpD family protein [Betaproteobacteria bacterium]